MKPAAEAAGEPADHPDKAKEIGSAAMKPAAEAAGESEAIHHDTLRPELPQ